MANRFIEAICEVIGKKSPDTIREEELEKIIADHMKDFRVSRGFKKSLKEMIFDGYSEEEFDGEGQ